MGGGRLRASTSDRVPLPPHSSRVHPRFRTLLRSPPHTPPPPSLFLPPPPPSFLRRQKPGNLHPQYPPQHPANPHTFPNSSLPPSRGEVRWGVRRNERPPATECPSRPTPPERIHASVYPLHPFRTPCAPSAYTPTPPPYTAAPPLSSFLRRQEPTARRGGSVPPPLAAERKRLWWAVGMLGRALGGRSPGSCLRRNDGGRAGITGEGRNTGEGRDDGGRDRGVEGRLALARCLPPPPNLPPSRGEG